MHRRPLACAFAFATVLSFGVSPPAAAEIVDANAFGFTMRHSLEIEAARADVYLAVVKHIGQWWSDEHTISGDASNLYLDAIPQGCFCERLGAGGAVHMTVTFVNPTVMLRLTGALGPLGLMGVSGNMTWEFEDSGTGTRITWSYAVGGYLPGGLDKVAPAVDRVLRQQMQRLKEYAEHAEPRD